MISAEVFMTILAMRKIQQLSIREIAKRTEKHRATIKKHLKGDAFPVYRARQNKEAVLSAYRQTVCNYLGEHAYQATWIYDRLQRMGYTGSYETVSPTVGRVPNYYI